MSQNTHAVPIDPPQTKENIVQAQGELVVTKPEPPGEAEEPTPVASVESLVKIYRRGKNEEVNALDGVSLDFNPGEFVVLLGPSGCGKTTLLRSIAGLERPDRGTVRLRSRVVFDASTVTYEPPEARGLSMMFQSYALWPNMTVADNVRYPLRSRRAGKGAKGKSAGKMQRREMDTLMRTALMLVGIPELEDRYPNQLSGGQQQRVALARAIVWRDDVVLFDEPLSNVDAKVRDDLRRELASMQREMRFAGIYVTHDQTEAMQLGDRIIVMRGGRIEQQGTPEDVYLRPQNRFVANFVGTSNEIPGTIDSVAPDGMCTVETEAGKVQGRLPAGVTAGAKDKVVVSWRPEICSVERSEPRTGNRWRVTLERPTFMGTYTECLARVGSRNVRVMWPFGTPFPVVENGETWLAINPEQVSVLPRGEGD